MKPRSAFLLLATAPVLCAGSPEALSEPVKADPWLTPSIDKISSGYGWEYDTMLTKKFDDHFTAIAGFSTFESEGDAFVGTAALPSTSRFTLELNYTF